MSNEQQPAPEPSAEQIETARLIVSKMLQFEEAAWGPVAVLIAEHDVKLQAELDAVKARFVIDTCDSQHKFVKLDGKETRCPECLAIGLALAREDLAQARAALAECQKDRERLLKFAGKIIAEHREDREWIGDLSGDFVQDAAVECGLLEERTCTEPCCDNCMCAAERIAPWKCYFETELATKAKALAGGAT